ncbi:hypothetical protein A8C32_00490 [Flavivirga aquatica]|uniref:Uncharacterized protein n=1 Tax=Flavivirga aquatica TaxID=1849968 RepID=A0A1E5TBQ8_9FLAO|nr:hypothetical protein [Flavivirga aquatica]OEK08790.1 hypothetical protein A8C32_00490 [Flavivirga aquatica]
MSILNDVLEVKKSEIAGVETAEDKKARLEANAVSTDSIVDTVAGNGIALRDTVTMSVNNDGYIVLNCSATIAGDDDFVGVYANPSLPQGDNLGGSHGWEWVIHTNKFPYTTKVQAQVGIVGVYWSKDYRTKNYVQVCYSASLPDTSPGTSVTGSSY